jgi:hypothetical protein
MRLALLFVLGISSLLVGQAIARPAKTISTTVLRVTPKPGARALQMLPADEDINLVSCTKAWCVVTWGAQLGYVSAGSIVALPDAPLTSVPAATPPLSTNGRSFSLPFSFHVGAPDAGPSYQEPGAGCTGLPKSNC